MSQLSRKRSSSAMSYTQSVKEGENPPAYTPEYEDVLAKAGIFMYQHLGPATISDTCMELCATLLNADYEIPKHSLFKDDLFWMALERVRSKNEWRVVRDIMPWIVPSAELLYIYGVSNLEHLIEEINVEWTKCMCLAGPRPKPDFAVGLMSSAFTDNEVEKLKFYAAPGKATLFTGKLYFPFLVCEVKCGENGLNIADRQNAHSASMAVNAIVQLYRALAVSRAGELHRKILVFSVSHDHTMVKIYGHYPLIEGDKTTFYRHLIHSFDFTALGGKDKWTAYKFTRKVYDTFFPTHLKRIQSAIAQLPDPPFESTAGEENESEVPSSQDVATSAPSSQDVMGFKKPKLPPKIMLQHENDRLKEQLRQRDDQFMLLLKQQIPSNASSGNESESQRILQQEIDRLKEQLRQRDDQFMLLLKQQIPSNASSGNESESQRILQQEIDRLKEQLRQRDDQFMLLLKQQIPSNASSGNESESQRILQQENDRLEQEMKQQIDELKEQNKQEREQSNQQHRELIGLLQKQQQELEQQRQQNQDLMNMLKQRLS